MGNDRIIEKVGWVTQMKSIPPLSAEFKEQQYLLFEQIVRFLQKNNMTTRIILTEAEPVTDDSQIKISDLTEEGFLFFSFGIRAWRLRYDRAKNKDKAIRDLSFIEKKLKEFREKQRK